MVFLRLYLTLCSTEIDIILRVKAVGTECSLSTNTDVESRECKEDGL
jgi:hypothetical protein